MTSYFIPMIASDGKGNERLYYGVISVEPTESITVKVGDTVVADGGTYAWSGTSAYASYTRDITITNNSAVEIAVSSLEKTSTKFTGSDITNQTIAANGGTKTFTITPTAEASNELYIEGGASAVNSSTFYSTGFDAVTITLDYTVVDASKTRITWPNGATHGKDNNTLAKADTITEEGIYGASYSFGFEAATLSSTDASWTVLDPGTVLVDGKDIDNTTTIANRKYVDNNGTQLSATIDASAVSAEDLKACGLTLDPNTGILSGTITDRENLNGKTFAVMALIGNYAAVGYYKIVVNAATSALAVSIDGSAVSYGGNYTVNSTTDEGTLSYDVTVTNGSVIDLTGLTLDRATGASTDMHDDVTAVWKSPSTGTIKKNGGTNVFTLTLPAKTTAGTYNAVIQVKDGSDVIFPFNVKLVVANRPEIQAPSGSGNTKGSITKDGNGSTLKVGTEVTSAKGIVLTAKDAPSGTTIDTDKASWSWSAQDGSELPAGLSISGNKIVGTPTKAGDFKVTLKVVNLNNDEEGKLDTTITIEGATSITATGGRAAANLHSTHGTYQTAYLFDGAVVGGSLSPINVTVRNGGTVATGELTVTIEDAVDTNGVPKSRADARIAAGSKDKFDLSVTSISNIPKQSDTSFTIAPNDTSKAGTYNAKVTISGNGVAPQIFYVQYTVTEPLALVDISSSLNKTVGDALDVSFVSTGAGSSQSALLSYDANGQGLVWYMNVKKNGVANQAETDTLLLAMGKAGFVAKSGAADGEIETGSWSNGKGYQIVGGKFAVASLTAKGTFAFDLYAETSNDQLPASGTDILLASQDNEISVLVNVAETNKVYVWDNTEEAPEAHKFADVESESTSITGSGAKAIKAITFKNQPTGYTPGEVKDTFTIKNVSTAAIKLSAEVINDDETATAYFDVALDTPGTAIGADETKTFTLNPHAAYPVGTKTATLVIKASTDNPGAIEEIRIPVSLAVEAPTYLYEVYEQDDEEETPIAELNLGNIVKSTATATAFTMKNTGNSNVTGDVTFKEVKDADGTEFGSGDQKKLNAIADIANANMERGKTANFSVTPSIAVGAAEVGEQEAYVEITFPSATTKKVYKVTWNVISNSASAELDPKGTVSMGSAEENYDGTKLSKTFTIENTGELATDVLKNVKLTLTGKNAGDVFSLDDETAAKIEDNGNNILAPSLGRGEKLTFTVNVASGFEEGSYVGTVTLNADNIKDKKPIVANLTFTVTADDFLATEASAAISGATVNNLKGVVLEGSRSTRLMETLLMLAPGTSKAGKNGVYATAKAYVHNTPASSNNAEYYINLNGDASATDYDLDVKFTYVSASSYYATIAAGPKCNVTTATSTLTNSEYEDTDLGTAFKTIDFTVLQNVVVDMSTAYVRNDEDTAYVQWTSNNDAAYGTNGAKIVYKVPYGSALSGVEGNLYNAALSTKSTKAGKTTVTGLPTGMVFSESGDTILESWFDDTAKDVFAEDTVIIKDYTKIVPKTHQHTYKKAAAETEGFAVWTWSEDNTATLTLKCDGEDEEGTKVITVMSADPVAISSVSTKLTCTQDESTIYTATWTDATTGHTFKSEKTVVGETHTGHKWQYVENSIKWASDYSTATISLQCANGEHDAVIDGTAKIQTLVPATTISKGPNTSASCLEKGTVTYIAIWKDEDGNEIHREISDPVSDQYGPHSYGTGTFVWDWSDKKAPTATLTVICNLKPEDATHNTVVEDIAATMRSEYTNGDQVWVVSYELDKTHTYSSTYTLKKSGVPVEGGDRSLNVEGVYDFVYTGKAITQPYLSVKWGDEPLTLNKDYTVKYADNVNVGSATITITGKGNYAETVTMNFNILRLPIGDGESTLYGFTTTAGSYTNGRQTDPKIAYNGKTLKVDTDYYMVDEEEFDDEGVKEVTLYGIGNYQGSVKAPVYAVDNKTVLPASKLSLTIDAKGVTSTVSDEAVYPNSFTLKAGRTEIGTVSGSDITSSGEIGEFNYRISNNTAPGNATVEIWTNKKITIDGKAYIGSMSKTYKIGALNLARVATVSGIPTEVYYRAAAYTVEDLTDLVVKNGNDELDLYTDYYVTIKNGDRAGNATVTIQGIGAYAGSKITKTMKIVKPTFADSKQIEVTFQEDGSTSMEDVPFTQGGVKPAVEARCVIDGVERTLVEGTDFTVGYTKNTKVGDTAKVTVTGKGNYQGKNTSLTFTIGNATMSYNDAGTGSVTYQRTDIKYASTKKTFDKYLNNKKPIVLDNVTGKRLVLNKDYTFKNEWVDVSGTAITLTDTISTQELYTTGGILAYARVYPAGNYAGGDVEYVDVPAIWIYGTQLTANLIEVNQNIAFTGDPITQESQLAIDGKGIITNLTEGVDYEIVGYKNNTKAGTATVTVRGTGLYGGTVNKTFKINKANINKQ